ncbi:MAG: DUF6057 family protein [Bacteroidales bacterium]
MENKRFVQYNEKLFTGFFCAGIFIFFAFFYNNHLHFVEQSQLFLLTGDYFLSKMSFPGGFSGYLGGFLMQFYFLSLAGPFIITLLLFGIQQTTRHILSVVNGNISFFPLSFLPALNAALILCDEFYPLSAIVGFLIALLLGWLYITIKKNKYRFIAGTLLIPLTYWLTGGSFLMLLAVILVFEILVVLRLQKKEGKAKKSEIADLGRLKAWHLAVYLVVAAGVPLLVMAFLILQPLMLTFISEFYYDLRTVFPLALIIFFALPAALLIVICFLPAKEKLYHAAIYFQITGVIVAGYFGFILWANFIAEEIFTYDYLARNERWVDVISFAEKKPPKNNLSLAMLNLSLAKTGKMGDRMFNIEQNGVDGLFLPFATDYFAPMMRSEIFFQLGMINASQECAFESMETTPNLNKSVRSIKRLAETNLINGHYEVAKKYIKLLKNTTFYRKWAKDTEKYLYNEDMINKHPVWGEMRMRMIKKNYFFKVQNMESTLNMLYILLSENPQNRIAFEYLMAYYLINKDLLNLMNCLPMMDKLNYSEIPISYQEAIMLVIGLTPKNQMSDIPLNVSEYTKTRMKTYTNIYTAYQNPQEFLRKRFSGTYWYYFHFKTIEINNEK